MSDYLPINPGYNSMFPIDSVANNRPTDYQSGGEEFHRYLLDNINRVNQMQLDADQAVQDLAVGETTDITQVMTAVEKADVAFQTLMAVRNKLVESYQEILRMRI